jgi:signal peptidase II
MNTQEIKSNKLLNYLLPFVLTLVIIIVDQVTKLIIVRNIPYPGIGAQVFGDFLRIVHTRNLGIAFSIGRSLPVDVRRILFIIVPTLILFAVLYYYFRSQEVTQAMRWPLAGIVGGGFGNQIDRIFRPEGVVDFIDVKFYGILGMQRWPSFNVADMSVVVSGVVLIILFILQEKRYREQKT